MGGKKNNLRLKKKKEKNLDLMEKNHIRPKKQAKNQTNKKQ